MVGFQGSVFSFQREVAGPLPTFSILLEASFFGQVGEWQKRGSGARLFWGGDAEWGAKY